MLPLPDVRRKSQLLTGFFETTGLRKARLYQKPMLFRGSKFQTIPARRESGNLQRFAGIIIPEEFREIHRLNFYHPRFISGTRGKFAGRDRNKASAKCSANSGTQSSLLESPKRAKYNALMLS